MRPDPYATGGVDPQRLIAELRRDLDQLAAEVRSRPGLPITQASSAFFIPATGTPQAPSSGAYLYVVGNEVHVRAPAGSYSTLPPEVPTAASVDPADNITSGNAPGSYSSSWAQQIYDGLVDTKNTVNAVITALKNADLMFG